MGKKDNPVIFIEMEKFSREGKVSGGVREVESVYLPISRLLFEPGRM